MRPRVLTVAVLFGLAGVGAWFCSAGCDSDSPTRPSYVEPHPGVPLADEEAELAALWLSGELYAPMKLYYRIQHELGLIRKQWTDSVPAVQIRFRPNWYAGMLSMGFYPETYQEVLAGEYDAWDELNETYGLDTMTFLEQYDHVSVRFTNRLNPMILVDKYAGLPGLRYVQTTGPCCDGPMLYMFQHGGVIKYFFRNAWGDCPSGCLVNEFYYFQVYGEEACYLGYYFYNDQDTVRPAWFDTLIIAGRNYAQYNSWRADTIPETYPCDTLQLEVPEIHQWNGDKEAKYVALYLSGEFNPPLELYARAVGDLAWIREYRPDSVSAVDTIRYRRGFHPGCFLARLDADGIEDSTSESYWLFRCLNEYFGFIIQSGYSWWSFHHGGIGPIVHPKGVIDAYTVVPAITHMKMSMDADVMPDIYTHKVSDTINYFVREVWGRFVPWEWEYQRYHFFETTRTNRRYVGSYTLEESSPPVWLDLALQAREDKYTPYEWIR